MFHESIMPNKHEDHLLPFHFMICYIINHLEYSGATTFEIKKKATEIQEVWKTKQVKKLPGIVCIVDIQMKSL